MTRPGKIPEWNPGPAALEADALTIGQGVREIGGHSALSQVQSRQLTVQWLPWQDSGGIILHVLLPPEIYDTIRRMRFTTQWRAAFRVKSFKDQRSLLLLLLLGRSQWTSPLPPPSSPQGCLSPANPVIHRCRQAVSGGRGCFSWILCTPALSSPPLLPSLSVALRHSGGWP